MNTLIIWESVPENIEVVIVPNEVLTDEQHQLILQAHGNFINGEGWENNDGLEFLNIALAEKTERNIQNNQSSKFLNHMGLLFPYRKYNGEENRLAQIVPAGESFSISQVICTGFLL